MTSPVQGIRRYWGSVLAAVAAVALIGCGGSGGGGLNTTGGLGTVSLTPATSTVAPGGAVTITGNRSDLVWGILPGVSFGTLSVTSGATTVFTPGVEGGAVQVEAQVPGHPDINAISTINVHGANLSFGTTMAQGLNASVTTALIGTTQTFQVTANNGGLTTTVSFDAGTVVGNSVAVGSGGASVSVTTGTNETWTGTSGSVKLNQNSSGFVSIQLINVTMSKSGSADTTLNGVIIAPSA